MSGPVKEQKIGVMRTLPKFDPDPSGVVAAHLLKSSATLGALIGRLAVWAWLP